jgi:hypothetical protein
MILPGFKKSKTNDDVILISHNEIKILGVSNLDEESVSAGTLKLPRADADVRYYPSGGRAFVYGWEGNYLAESERIAELEQNIALKSMFNFGAKSQLNIPFFIMAAILVITIFVLHH